MMNRMFRQVYLANRYPYLPFWFQHRMGWIQVFGR